MPSKMQQVQTLLNQQDIALWLKAHCQDSNLTWLRVRDFALEEWRSHPQFEYFGLQEGYRDQLVGADAWRLGRILHSH